MKKNVLILLLALTSLSFANLYEVRMTYTPVTALPNMLLRHPTCVDDTSNIYCNLDCGLLTKNPDWGAKQYTYDNPILRNDNIDGSQTITSSQILDPGDCRLLVFCGSGIATCNVEIVSWPGVAPTNYQAVVAAGPELWDVTTLPCAQDIHMRIIKATQKKGGSKYLWVKIIAEFEDDFVLKPVSNTLNSSLQDEHWFKYDIGDKAKVNKKGNKATFYGSSKVTIKNKNKRIKIFAKAFENYQSESMQVFFSVNGCSGIQNIKLDDKSRYIAPKVSPLK